MVEALKRQPPSETVPGVVRPGSPRARGTGVANAADPESSAELTPSVPWGPSEWQPAVRQAWGRAASLI